MAIYIVQSVLLCLSKVLEETVFADCNELLKANKRGNIGL